MHLPAEARQMKRKAQEGTAGKEKKQMSFQIAIDGPAGAGKSTIARMVAKEKVPLPEWWQRKKDLSM